MIVKAAESNRKPVWAVIPVKPLHGSKMRLAHVLTAPQRAELIAGFLAHTLSTLRHAPGIASAIVVTSDAAVQAIAQEYGAQTLTEREPEGLNLAVQRGVNAAVGAGAQAVLILPADLPFVAEADMVQMIATADKAWSDGNGNGRGLMTICADAAQQGTNALLLYPPTPFTFHYGPGSFQQHLQEARHHGRTVQIVAVPGLQFDLDTAADWYRYCEIRQQTAVTHC